MCGCVAFVLTYRLVLRRVPIKLMEGAEKRLFHAAELQAMPNVIPQDLAVVLMHARRDILFRAKPAAPPADSMPSGE